MWRNVIKAEREPPIPFFPLLSLAFICHHICTDLTAHARFLHIALVARFVERGGRRDGEMWRIVRTDGEMSGG